jgi:hypothetical protein
MGKTHVEFSVLCNALGEYHAAVLRLGSSLLSHHVLNAHVFVLLDKATLSSSFVVDGLDLAVSAACQHAVVHCVKNHHIRLRAVCCCCCHRCIVFLLQLGGLGVLLQLGLHHLSAQLVECALVQDFRLSVLRHLSQLRTLWWQI